MGGDVIVVGGGVIGLSTAVVLAEQGRRVRVWSRDPAVDTTSAVAGGLWWPYRIRPGKRVGDWSLRSLRAYAEQSAAPDETGVRMVSGVMAGTDRASLGAWASSVPDIRAARADELPAGHGPGIRARIPLVDMPVLLRTSGAGSRPPAVASSCGPSGPWPRPPRSPRSSSTAPVSGRVIWSRTLA